MFILGVKTVTISFLLFLLPRLELLITLLRLRFILLRLYLYLVILRLCHLIYIVFVLVVGLSYFPLLYALVVVWKVDPVNAVYVSEGYWVVATRLFLGEWGVGGGEV